MKEQGTDTSKVKNILREFASIFAHLALLLVAAGRADWINAWVCAGLALFYQSVNIAVLKRYNPDLIARRGRLIQKDTKSFDKAFVPAYVVLTFVISAMAGLDAVRFEWSSMPLSLNASGVLIYVLSCALGIWSMAVNRHFEMTVVIKTGGEQQVCDSGPYRAVRHPGYLAAILGILAYPLILGSWWAFVLSILLSAVFVVRTALEDRSLRQELPGYKEYTEATPYRLLPMVW